MAWWALGSQPLGPPPPAFHQVGVAQQREVSLTHGSARRNNAQASNEGAVRQLRQLSRLLTLEEMAMEDHIRRSACWGT